MQFDDMPPPRRLLLILRGLCEELLIVACQTYDKCLIPFEARQEGARL
jgi:hypothetical protein